MNTDRERTIERRKRLARNAGFDRMSIFVPAVMSVGLLFWLLSEVREVAGAQRRRSRAKRAELAAAAIAARLGDASSSTPAARGLRPRPVYLLLSAVLLSGAAYVAVGSIANYVRPGGYVSDVAWLLAVSLVVSGGAATLGLAAPRTAARAAP